MKRRLSWLLVLLVGGLAGCDVFLNVPLVVTPITQTIAIDDGAGYATAIWELTGKGIVTVGFGDGQNTTVTMKLNQKATIRHTYVLIGTYAITVKQGMSTTRCVVTVTAMLPQVAAPFYLNALVEDGERITFNLTRRDVGCDNGMVVFFSGIEPGDGVTEFQITAFSSTGTPISLFDSAGRNVWGEWLLLEPIRKNLQLITCWAGWSEDTPKIPMGSRGASAVTPLDCGDTCPDNPWIPPEIPSTATWIVFTLAVRTQYMGPVDYLSLSWRIAVVGSTC